MVGPLVGRSAAENALRRVRGALGQLNRREWFAPMALVSIGLGLRLIAVSSRPLWYDEAFAVLFAEKGLAAMIRGTLSAQQGAAADVHPLGYYTLLSVWMEIFGQSPVAIRLLSILAGVGVLILAYALALDLFNPQVARWSLLLVALAPFQIHYAQEIRMYALLAFLLLLSTLALWRGIRTRRWYWWLFFAVGAALSQYTHNLAAIYLLPLAITPLLIQDWRAVRATFLAGLLAVTLYLPWLVQLPSQLAKIGQAYWTTRPAPSRLLTVLLSFTTNLPLPGPWLVLGLFIALLSLVFGIWRTAVAVRVQHPGWKRGLWLGYLALAPVVFLFLISQWQAVFIERALIASGVAYLLWLGWAITLPDVPKAIRWVTFSILAAGFVLGGTQHVVYAGFPYAPYKSLDQSLSERVAPGEVILHSNKLSALPSVYYDRDLAIRYLPDPPGSGSDTLAPTTQEVLGLVAAPDLETATRGAERVWFLIFDQAVDEYLTQGGTGHPHLEWLEENYHLERVESWVDLQMYIYGP